MTLIMVYPKDFVPMEIVFLTYEPMIFLLVGQRGTLSQQSSTCSFVYVLLEITLI